MGIGRAVGFLAAGAATGAGKGISSGAAFAWQEMIAAEKEMRTEARLDARDTKNFAQQKTLLGEQQDFTAAQNAEARTIQRQQNEATNNLASARMDQADARADATERRADERTAAAEARTAATQERANRPQATAYVDAMGNPVRLDPVTQTYKVGDKVVDSADLVTAADFNKNLQTARPIITNLDRAQSILDDVEKNKSTFDTGRVMEAKAKGMVPGIGGTWAAGVFTQDENVLRSKVARESAAIVNELYGAALSVGEQTRAATFAPGPEDTIEQLLPKLRGAVDWAKTQEKSLLPGAVERARRQIGGGQAAPAGTPDPATGSGQQQYSQEDLEHTARIRGLTVEQVKKLLGVP